MADKKDLSHKKAIRKMQKLGKRIKVCMFCTSLENAPFMARPMSTQAIDDDGNFWFLSGKNSNKNTEIKQDDKVQLIYSDAGSASFLSVYGKAEIYTDRGKIEKLWNPIAKAWFKKGKKDPSLTVICVKSQEGYYWDTKNGKWITLLKIAAAAVTGKTPNEGQQGQILADGQGVRMAL